MKKAAKRTFKEETGFDSQEEEIEFEEIEFDSQEEEDDKESLNDARDTGKSGKKLGRNQASKAGNKPEKATENSADFSQESQDYSSQESSFSDQSQDSDHEGPEDFAWLTKKDKTSGLEEKRLRVLRRKQKPDIDAVYQSDSSDEETLNTVGNIPMEWYNDYPHIGYDINGKKIMKPAQGDDLDKFLSAMDDKDSWYVILLTHFLQAKLGNRCTISFKEKILF